MEYKRLTDNETIEMKKALLESKVPIITSRRQEVEKEIRLAELEDEIENGTLRKITWHKVEDNDLPTKTGDYLVIYKNGNYAVLRYCAEDPISIYNKYYDEEKDHNLLNMQKGFNNFDKEMFEYYPAIGVVAWMEIPKFKE